MLSASFYRLTLIVLTAMATLLCPGLDSSEVLAQTDRYGNQSTAERRFTEGRALEIEAEREGAPKLYTQAAQKYAQAIERDPDLIPAYIRFGYVMYVLDRSDEAIKLMRVAYKKAPDNIDVQHQLGLTLHQLGEPDEAVDLLQRVSTVHNDRPDVEFILGKYRLGQERYEEARSHFQRYSELNPNDPQGPRALGTIYLAEQRFEEALAQMERVLALDPSDTTARANIGNAHYAMGHYEQALAAYDVALESEPDRFDVHYNKASALYQTGQPQSAMHSFRRAAEIQPDSLAAWYFTGDSALRSSEPELALDAFARVLEIKEDYAHGHLRMAEAHAMRGSPEDSREAGEHLSMAVELRGEDPELRHLVGVVYREMGDFERALEQARIATEQKPDNALYQIGRADVLLELGRFDDAIRVYRDASKVLENAQTELAERVRTGLSYGLLSRGVQTLQAPKGDRKAARADFEEARRIDRHPLAARINLAALALGEGELETARKHTKRALGLAPSDTRVRLLNARLLVAEGRDEEAEAALSALESEGLMTEHGWHDRALLLARSGGRWDDASRAFKRAQDSPRNVALTLYEQGLDEAEEGQWRGAMRLFEKALKHRKALSRTETTRLELAMGYATFESGDYERALSLFEEVAEDAASFPKRERERLARGGELSIEAEIVRLLYALGRYDKALERMELSNVKLPKLERSMHAHLGRAELDKGELEEAERHLRAALSGDGEGEPEVRFNLAVVLYERGDVDEAGVLFEKLARKGQPLEAVLNYAVYLDDVKGDNKGAIKHYKRYLEASGSRSDEVREILENKRVVFGDEL